MSLSALDGKHSGSCVPGPPRKSHKLGPPEQAPGTPHSISWRCQHIIKYSCLAGQLHLILSKVQKQQGAWALADYACATLRQKIFRAVFPGQHKQASRSGPSVPACFKQAQAPAPALGTRKVQHVLYTVQRAHWGGQMVWWGNVHKNIEIDELGAAFGGSSQGPWQEVQGRTWSAWLFAAPDTGTPVERHSV